MIIARCSRLAFVALLAATPSLGAQTGYYNLDAGRPTRIEDAIPTALREIELQFLPLRAEWLSDGTERYRFEPKVAYGMLPRTEIEVRAPVMEVRSPNTAETVGLASLGVGALHAFNIETGPIPAFALAAEMVLPVGSLSAPIGSYSLKGLVTKTFPFARLQLNAGGGTWSAGQAASSSAAGTLCGNAPGVPPCLIPDVPCDIVARSIATARDAPSFACAPAALTLASGTTRATGPHWTAAIGLDHTFPMISTLVTGDVVVDRFAGLYPLDDWTAEIGVRRQLTPQLIADAGLARRFAGTTQSTSIIVGVSYAAPLRALLHR